MTVTPELIDRLYLVQKHCHEIVEWKQNPHVSGYVNLRFNVRILTEEGEPLDWFGWFNLKHGERRWGFKIQYRNRYDVRSWDMASKHRSTETGKMIRGVGCHKHRYFNESERHATYEIPRGEISIDDPNKAVFDFCDECNIKILGGYQQQIFP